MHNYSCHDLISSFTVLCAETESEKASQLFNFCSLKSTLCIVIVQHGKADRNWLWELCVIKSALGLV